MSERQKLFFALLASAFFHLALGVTLALWSAQHAAELARVLPDLSQLTVTIMPPRHAEPPMPPPPPPPQLAARARRPFIDSDGLTPSAKAPAHALFQSDENMVAGSQLPAEGNAPLPTIAGPEHKFLGFADRAASIGKAEHGAPPPPAPAAPPRQAAAAAAAAAPPLPQQTPYGVSRVEQAPTPVPRPTPADSLALGTPTPPPATPQPTPLEFARLTPSMRAHADIAPMPAQAAPAAPPRPQAPPQPAAPPQPPAPPSTQRELDRSHIAGGITTRGRPGIDAAQTPYGRYHHVLSNIIGSRWNLYQKEHPTDVGDVTILFKISPAGKVVSTRVLANHSLDDLPGLSTRAIMDSKLPPVPDDLAPMLKDGMLEITFSFTVYDVSHDSPGR